jgi:two-component sensor histidine kinase
MQLSLLKRVPVRGRSFRLYLAAFALCLVLPAFASTSVLLGSELWRGRARFEQQLLATARALSSSLDAQVGEGIALNEALAASELIQEGRFPQFREMAGRALKGRSGWIVLTDEQGRQWVNTATADGKLATAPVALPPNMQRALTKRRTEVSNLVLGRLVQRPIIAIDTPVFGRKTYVLSYIQEPNAYYDALRAQRLPDQWIGAILDRNARIIARTLAQERMVGAPALPGMRRRLRESFEGTGKSHSFEGVPTVLAYHRSQRTGWTLLIAVPRRQLDNTIFRASVGLALTLFGLLCLGILLALLFSQGIVSDLNALVRDAQALRESDAVGPREGLIWETQQVHGALAVASRELLARERRNQMMIGELNHRVKNTLATVQALANQTFRKSPETASEVADFSGRLLALAQAHDLLTAASWGATDLRPILERCHVRAGENIRLDGPSVSVPPQAAVALTMIGHELTTNSLKYGALSAAGGEIRVSWSVIDPASSRVRLTWTEIGGPKVSAPDRQGFGARLIERLTRYELAGTAEFTYPPEGLLFVAEISLQDQARWRNDFA